MEEKNTLVIEYISNITESFEKSGHPISNEAVQNVTKKYLNSSLTFEEIKKEIDELVEQKIEELRKRQEFLEKFSKLEGEKRLEHLEIPFNGITLNNQDIDLMLIAGANNPQELQDALSKISNIKISLNTTELSNEQFISARQKVYDMYLDRLTSRTDYIRNRKIELARKIDYLKSSGILTSDEIAKVDEIISTSRSNEEISGKLNQSFSQDKVHAMYLTIRDFTPIEKQGMKTSTIEASLNLLEEIRNNYNSITIDEEAKYGKVALQDGTFDFRHLQKSLDFAKSLDKQVRLNTLLFYMDCPEELYSLDKTPENRALVKQKLQSYVDATTRFVVDNGYSDTVRSVDVFNELLNRFAMSGDTPYMYRGDIPQTTTELGVDDNIKAGWLKHLDMSDLCDVIAVARRNMPTTDFMYNDDHLIDPAKITATIGIISQIREYEQKNGVKLIDSIGTQMHVDNNMTKDQMREMIVSLSRFGLPIEITEFDIAMTNGVENLTPEEIETLRQKKINEIYDCVDELREKCDIRGFTIWSKTDAQNFRVFLANEERIPKGLEPIETLHGGYYDSKMQPKTKSKRFSQDFNYHTHTFRSGHGQYCSDEEMLLQAKKNGIKMLGFTEHIPNPELILPDEDHRMLLSEVDDYVDSINKLKSQNPDMTILSGFEVEYDPMKETFFGEMRKKVDYMILGQHFVPKGLGNEKEKGNPDYPIVYANMIVKALDSGLFDIVAHPDHFMSLRDSMPDEESKRLFDENSVLASQIICEKARDMGVPIELNLGPAETRQVLHDGNLAYPHPLFWKVASEIEGLQVLKGIDAHHLGAFDKASESEMLVSNITEMVKDKMLPNGYNPVVARQQNVKLQNALEQSQARALTFETHMVSQIVNGGLSRLEDGLDSESLAVGIATTMNGAMQSCIDNANKKDKAIVDEISTIAESPEMSASDKKAKMSRKKKALEETNQVLANQQKTIEIAKGNVVNAINIGCETKPEFSNMMTQITEHGSTKNESSKMQLEEHITGFQQSKTNTNNYNLGKEQGYQLKKVKKDSSTPTSNNGFINAVTLSLIVTFVVGVAVGIGYMLYRISIGG